MPFREAPEPRKSQQVSNASSVLGIPGFPFWQQESIQKSCIFEMPSWTSIFPNLCWALAEKCDFWIPFGTHWAQNGTPNHPGSAKRLHKSIWPTYFLRTCDRLTPRIAFGALLGTSFVDFGRCWMHFGCNVRRSEERRVGKECRSRWSTYH